MVSPSLMLPTYSYGNLSNQQQLPVLLIDDENYPDIASNSVREVSVPAFSLCAWHQGRAFSCSSLIHEISFTNSLQFSQDQASSLAEITPGGTVNQSAVDPHLALLGIVAVVCVSLSVVALAALGRNIKSSITWGNQRKVDFEANQSDR